MDYFETLDVSASGIEANRVWMSAIAENVANANTTRTGDGGPYRAKQVRFSEELNKAVDDALSQKAGGGVKAEKFVDEKSPFPLVYKPTHPDAGPDGYVRMPNVNTIVEMTNMIEATRAYEANIAVLGASRDMLQRTFDIGR